MDRAPSHATHPQRKGTRAKPRGWLAAAWKGNLGKSFYLAIWIPLLTALWGTCFYFAWRTYPNYQLPKHDISFLGHPRLNPNGWWFWSVGMGITAILLPPLVAYTSRRMKELTITQDATVRLFLSTGSISLYLSCVGLMGLALAPQGRGYDFVHQTAGVFAFGGMYATLLLFWSFPLFKTPNVSLARAVLLTASAWWGVCGFFITQGYRFFSYGELGHPVKHKGESLLLRFSLWEWMLFFALTTSFGIFVMLLPGRARIEGNASR